MGNNSVPKFIFRLSRFPVYRGSVLGRFYCTENYLDHSIQLNRHEKENNNFVFINVESGTFHDRFKIWVCNSPTVYRCKEISMCTVHRPTLKFPQILDHHITLKWD